MFGNRILKHIKNNLPELEGLHISVGGRLLNIGGYEMVNALLIQNNVLNENKQSIAIYHPKSDLLDVFLLIFMGIAAYKDSIIRNSKLRLNDFKEGELVEYEGKIVVYDGIFTDPSDKIERFQIRYGDEYVITPTLIQMPLKYFSEVSKYFGSKTIPDTSESKKSKRIYQDSLQDLLGYKDQQIGLSGYSTFLVASERTHLIELLKEVTINGISFFEMFPSVKCTSEHKYRLGRDRIQRAPMFYFVSTLSTADDVLRIEPLIKTLFVDACGKSLNDGSLLASIRNQYDLEDIYWLQTYDKLESAEKLESGLGFKVWIWGRQDYAELIHNEPVSPKNGATNNNDFSRMVEKHNNTPARLAAYEDILVEVSYPQGMSIEQHSLLQARIREMFSLSSDYNNPDLQNFSIRAAGITNRIFQSSLSTVQLDIIARDLERRSFKEDIEFLKERMAILIGGPLQEGFEEKALELISSLETCIEAFKEYSGKCSQAAAVIKENHTKKICILTNPKYPSMSSLVKERIITELDKTGHRSLGSTIVVTDNLTQAVSDCEIIIWMYKPQAYYSLMIEPGARKNYILLYPLQKKELEQLLFFNSHRFQHYFNESYRAEILKVPSETLERISVVPFLPLAGDEPFDLEKLLSSTLAKVLPSYGGAGHSEMVEARMVLFSDGSHALFQPGNKIKILDLEHETIETKTVGSLSEGDQVVFLKDSKRTVFDELVDFYEHKPEIVELVKLSELWRTALLTYRDQNYLNPTKLKILLDGVGLVRHVVTIENWLDGITICPDEDDYAPVDMIAALTDNSNLKENLDKVKNAARKIHALRIKIGRYLAKRITQSYISPDSIIDDPVLRDKLDNISSHVQIAQVFMIKDETVRVPADITNKPLTVEDV